LEPRSGDDKPELPRPTLWPVGFAIGVACILVGLVVSWPAVAVGGAIAIVFGALWARDLATRRAHPAPQPSAGAPSTDAPAIPAHEGREAMPPPRPGERFPRSRFLEGATLGIGAAIGAVVTLPAVAFAIIPPFLKQGHKGVDLGPLSDYPEGKWQIVHFFLNEKEGDVTRRTAYIRYNGLLGKLPSFTIISNRCAHLGCPVQPNGLVDSAHTTDVNAATGDVSLTPINALAGFGCPCHGGQYDQEGNRTAGPPVRALDRFDFAIVKGRLFLGNAYSVKKVDGSGADAKIHRYVLTGPGQHIEDWESWLYPVQPPH
jgi:menaquinol-cytochrome c reductase iron-sulfur subunit